MPAEGGAGGGGSGDFRARAMVGGTITSTLLTLLVIPTVYEILDGWHSKVGPMFHRG